MYKCFSILSNLINNLSEIDLQTIDRHTWGKWLIHAHTPQRQPVTKFEAPRRISQLRYKTDTRVGVLEEDPRGET